MGIMDFFSEFFEKANNFVGEMFVEKPDNSFTGVDTIYYPNGSTYTGTIIRGKRDGYGRMFFTYEGKTYAYVGEWKNDVRNGKGVLIHKDDKLIEFGEWEEDKIIGKSIQITCDGNVFFKEFENNACTSKIFCGNFLSFKKAAGFISDACFSALNLKNPYSLDTREYDRIKLINRQYVSNKGKTEDCDGYGLIINRFGEAYLGELKNGKPHGRGDYRTSDGIIIVDGNTKTAQDFDL